MYSNLKNSNTKNQSISIIVCPVYAGSQINLSTVLRKIEPHFYKMWNKIANALYYVAHWDYLAINVILLHITLF